MNVALFGRKFSDDFIPFTELLIKELEKHQINIWVFAPFHKYLQNKIPWFNSGNTFIRREDIPTEVDFLFSMGGDGTILDTVTSIQDSGIPIVGINSGRLGFLANISKDEIEKVVGDIINNNYRIEERTLLQLDSKRKLFHPHNFALNELTVHKKDSASLMTIHTYVNDDYLNSYWADGLIIATPTGSTAYSLSCGGPILMPGSNNFVITPIAPHNLSVRPIIIPDTCKIRVKAEGREDVFLATIDSRSEELLTDDELTISRANFTIKLVQFTNQNFFTTIRNKLLWGLDKRN